MQNLYSIEQKDDELRNSNANIQYTLGFENANQHLVNVLLVIRNIELPIIRLVMPVWSPGSYKIRDYAAFQGNVQIRTHKSTTILPSVWINKSTLEITTLGATEIEIEYTVYAHERSVRTSHVNSTHAFLVLTGLCMYVENRQFEVHHVGLKNLPAQWSQVSTALSRVVENEHVYAARNYDILADSPMEIGNHVVREFKALGALHQVALVSQDNSFDIDWLVEHIQRIVEVEAQIFNGVPYDRYVFIVQVYPGIYGGLEHARSSVNAVDPVAFSDKQKALELLSLICHEYFHLWNVKRIRPIELGPFDYTTENYTSMLWLAEGLTSYYDDLLAYRCKFSTAKEYLEVIARDHLSKLDRVSGRTKMSVKDSSKLAWIKLYMPNPDGANRFPSYYLKGGIIFLLLDLYIIEHTDGKVSMDAVLRGLWQRYLDNPGVGITEDECIAIIERSTGVQIRERLLSWLNGTDELPYSELFSKFGLTVVKEDKAAVTATFGEGLLMPTRHSAFVGAIFSEIETRVVVRSVEDYTPSFEAGLGVDDEIVSANGIRVQSAQKLESIFSQNIGKKVTLIGQRDSNIFTTTIVPKPLQTISLKEETSPTKQQQHLKSVWLNRHN